jgi:VWFA-related protein
MRVWLLFALGFSGFLFPAEAEKAVSVSQLEQAVSALSARPDGDAAQHLSDLHLTERISTERFAAMSQRLPGEKSRQALLILYDESEFLDPPASEIPSRPAPDLAEQRRIMSLVVGYVKNAIPQLPNFFATRTTNRFEDTPLLQKSLSGHFFVPYQPMHLTGRSQATVLYRNGLEVVEANENQKSASGELTTWGVFGPILSTVLVDAATSKLQWSRWETNQNGAPQAVFEFQVPHEKSHYQVNYCCVATENGIAAADTRPFRRIVPYHGSMLVDPSTGAILRLIVKAELKPADPVSSAAILVDYGPIEIAGRAYICPTRSLSTTTAQIVQIDPTYKFALADQMQPLKNALNDVSFDQYHIFRSDMRVLTPEEADLARQSIAATNAQSIASTSENEQPPPAPSEAASAPASVPTKAEASVSAASATPEPLVANSTPAPEAPATPEISSTDATRLPDLPGAQPQPGADTGYRLRTTSRLVEVTVVAFDKKGRPITDLKPGDLEIYDNGRKQIVNSFAHTESGASSNSPAPQTESSTQPLFSNRPAEPATAPSATARPAIADATVFLIDAAHVAFPDLSYARSEMLRFLKSAPSNEPVGLYILKKSGFQVLMEPTTNHAGLAQVLIKWSPSAQDLSQAQNEEERNRQSMDYVNSLNDLFYVNGNTPTGQSDIFAPVDPRLRSLGDNPQRDVLSFFVWIARHLAATPGHKSLIWVSSDNVLADFTDQAPHEEQGDKHLDPLALSAREALNDAGVSIYPLDASQLEAGGVGASIQSANVQVVPGSDTRVQSELQQLPPGMQQEASEALAKSQRNTSPGRLTAQMRQDTHAIQPVFRELAQATGGRAFRRAGDIAGEITSAVNDGRSAYVLTFTPDTPADGAYHQITVKSAARRDITLRYRTGYFYEKEPATLKERFQNAVWRPADLGEIALSATPGIGSNPATLKLNIAATDIALAQQAGLWMDKLDIFLIHRDDARLNATLDGRTVAMRLKPSTYKSVLKTGISIDQPVKTPPDSGALRIVVIDENSGRIGTLTLPASAFSAK